MWSHVTPHGRFVHFVLTSKSGNFEGICETQVWFILLGFEKTRLAFAWREKCLSCVILFQENQQDRLENDDQKALDVCRNRSRMATHSMSG